MRRFFNFAKNIIVAVSISISLFLLFNELQYRDVKHFISPLDEGVVLTIRDDAYGDGHFGARRKGGRRHNGIDLSAPLGTTVRALRSGWIVGSRESTGLGKYVEIYHGRGLITIYAHLSQIKVSVLDRVKQGQVIGAVGKTGNAEYKNMEAHLHLEVIENSKYQDPTPKLPGLN